MKTWSPLILKRIVNFVHPYSWKYIIELNIQINNKNTFLKFLSLCIVFCSLFYLSLREFCAFPIACYVHDIKWPLHHYFWTSSFNFWNFKIVQKYMYQLSPNFNSFKHEDLWVSSISKNRREIPIFFFFFFFEDNYCDGFILPNYPALCN